MGRTFNLEINTTKKCNMSCTYCFEKETIKKANIEEKKSIMQPKEIVKFLENNITYLNMPLDSLFSSSGKFLKVWEHLNEYDAYVDLHSLVHGNNELLEKIIHMERISFY